MTALDMRIPKRGFVVVRYRMLGDKLTRDSVPRSRLSTMSAAAADGG